MTRLNKKALYQLATSQNNTNSSPNALSLASPVKVIPTAQIPDGRLCGPLGRKLKADDKIKVSTRVRLGKTDAPQRLSKTDIGDRLGHGSLGSLANAFFEQQLIADEEIHTVQQRFYGLNRV